MRLTWVAHPSGLKPYFLLYFASPIRACENAGRIFKYPTILHTKSSNNIYVYDAFTDPILKKCYDIHLFQLGIFMFSFKNSAPATDLISNFLMVNVVRVPTKGVADNSGHSIKTA